MQRKRPSHPSRNPKNTPAGPQPETCIFRPLRATSMSSPPVSGFHVSQPSRISKKSLRQKHFVEPASDQKTPLPGLQKSKNASPQKQHKLGCPRPPQTKKSFTKRQNNAFESYIKEKLYYYIGSNG